MPFRKYVAFYYFLTMFEFNGIDAITFEMIEIIPKIREEELKYLFVVTYF